MMFPYEVREEIERINKDYSRTDQIIPLLVINNNKEEILGYKLVGVRATVTQRVVKLDHKVYNNGHEWVSLDNDRRARW
jgi:hypothetical protein